MPIWTLAIKELRLLSRDWLAAILLLLMPLLLILILGLLLGEGFGQKVDKRLRVAIVDQDQGFAERIPVRDALAWLEIVPSSGLEGLAAQVGGVSGFQVASDQLPDSWAKIVQRDLEQTAEIRVEILHDPAEAQVVVDNSKRAAVLVFGPHFSERVERCSFLSDGINPFYRDGIQLSELDVHLLKDKTQDAAASIIEQVAQVTLLRVLLPWMIGRAFEKLSDPSFIDLLGKEVRLPVPVMGKVPLNRLLTRPEHKEAVGSGVQKALGGLFRKYDLTGKNWTALTKSDPKLNTGVEAQDFVDEGGRGLFHHGAARYQILIPSMTVMFAFVLVLTVGLLIVTERRQGTLRRIWATPLSKWQVLLGKLLPYLGVSVVQGLLLLVIGKLVFGLRWGPTTWSLGQQASWLFMVVACTSLAAMGMAMLLAVLARTEIEVALFGSLLVLLLALISGCLVPRALFPESARQLTLITPHAWALEAYNQLLLSPTPNLDVVIRSCLVLVAFGLVFIQLAWISLKKV